MRRLLVCGGRKYRNGALLYQTLDKLHAEHQFSDFMQGGATGADALAKEWARTKPEITRWECKAAWTDLTQPGAVIKKRADGTLYDARAGHRRNVRMMEWQPDLVVAFPGDRGTKDMVELAHAGGVVVMEIK